MIDTNSQKPLEDLQAMVQEIRDVAVCYNLLDKALMPHAAHDAQKSALEYLRRTHETLTARALEHPEAASHSELQQMNAAQQKADSNV